AAAAASPATAMPRALAGDDQLAEPAVIAGLGGRGRLGSRTRGQDGEGDEGEEPGDVGVEPVGEDDLEADQERAGLRGELQRVLAARPERGRERAEDEERLQRPLDEVEV